MAVSSTFDPNTGILTTTGDDLDNTITTSRNAAGTILINGGAVPIQGGTATVANTTLVSIFGQAGNDTIALDESNGALPAAFMVGGDGNDTMTGGSGGDQLIGGAGNDTLLGKGGNDFLQGGEGNDVLTGGDGDDAVFGQGGDDRMIWNPGDDSDVFEGGDGVDTAEVNGGNGAEVFTVTANGSRVRFDRVSPAPFSIDIGTTENLVVNANGGDDVITAGNGLAGLIQLTIDGGAGNDTITGGDGNDVLLGGDGNDIITGGRGNDTALLGAGNDTFVWNPGDGNDTVEGQDGVDALVFNGANVNENVTISANGSRVNFFRDVANVTMDLNGVEGITFGALGGADNITINDVSGTDLALSGVAIDLGVAGSGDGAADTVTVNGRAGNDSINISAASGTVLVTGSPTTVAISNAEAANDRLIINGGTGDDTFSATGNLAALISLTVDGGAGNDTILGGNGADVLLGGDGNDFIDGNQGNDTAFLGAGDDVFQWDPGDGSDTVEGQAGLDRLDFNGANINENFDISANGERVLLTRNVGSIVMDVNDVEGIIVRALGGTDNIVINDVSGTDLALSGVAVELEGAIGSGVGDGAADTVTVDGRAGSDAINVSLVNGVIFTTGSPSTVVIFNAEAANDRLIVNGGGGDDTINASALAANAIGLTVDGGAGNDVLIGSAGADLLLGGDGNDTVTGGRGDDVALLGAGNDVFFWNPGDGNDTVEGQDGLDGLIFNGANVNESIDISANGGRVRFSRDVANVTMDLNDVEGIRFEALGGVDKIVINDVSGTDLSGAGIAVDLEGAVGSGVADGQVDTVTVNATAGDDAITVSTVNGIIKIVGAPAPVNIFHADTTDQLVVNGGAGDDVINASALPSGQIGLTLNGGLGDDVLIGSQGNDLVVGGDGDDVALLGAGNDVFVWNPGDDNDTVEGQAGVDGLIFNGANINENIDISANGGRVRFSRDIANVTMDLNGVEGIKFEALGGADKIVINDMSGTDLTGAGVAVDLEGAIGSGAGDGAVDTVTVNDTAGNDAITVNTLSNGAISVAGTSASVRVFHAEATDQLVVNGGGGDDTINASALPAGRVTLTLDGGAGNDTLIGGAGNDVLIGGAGLDHLSGGANQDTFVFTGANLATLDTGLGASRDVIQDFNADVIDLHQIDANVNTAGDEAFSFIGTNAFTAAGQVRFFADGAGNTIVEGNVDNNLGADFQIELHAFAAQLQAGNFVL